jgi:hypothetical protein
MSTIAAILIALSGSVTPYWTGCCQVASVDVTETVEYSQAVPGNSSQEHMPVRVVLVPVLDKPSAKAMVLRSAAGQEIDAVFVTRRTSPTELAQALMMLSRAPERSRPSATAEMRAYVESRPDRDTPNTAFAAGVLERLNGAPMRPLRGHGNARYVIVPIPLGPAGQR